MSRRGKLLLLLVLAISLIVSGCADLAGDKNKDNGKQSIPITVEQGKTAGQTKDGKPENGEMTLIVYYASADAMNIVPERYTVAKNDHPALSALELLMKDPQNKQLLRVFPENIKVNSLVVKEHTAYVDFEHSLLKKMNGGSTTEMLLVASLVDTLTEFPDIQQVQILIDGKKVQTLTGHMDVSGPLGRNEALIKQ